MSSQKRLFLLDAYALIFRGYYALIKNPRINSKGMDTSAILGFTNSLLDVIKREKPDHLAVAFDKGGSAARNAAFPDYKSNRQETPEAIKMAVPYIQQLLEAMHIPVIEKSGYEADDLIGTLAKQAEKEGYQTFMVTPDKDFAQLVSENIFMYRPARMGNGIEIWGIPEVQAKFEVQRPEQVIDYLGMMGDAVDNIPGLPGVGDKTAKKFIQQYGSMETLLENTHELKGKMKEKVEANKALGLLSKQLATILLDCPVRFHEEDFRMSQPDFEQVNTLFQELEFRRIADTFARIFKKPVTAAPKSTGDRPDKKAVGSPASGQQYDLFAAVETAPESPVGFQSIENSTAVYQYVDSALARQLLLTNLLTQTSVAFHLEVEQTGAFAPPLIGMAVSYEKGSGYFVRIPTAHQAAILAEFRPFFEHPEIEKIGEDIKYAYKLLQRFDCSLNGPLFDTRLAHYLLHPDRRHDLQSLAETQLNYQLVSLNSLIGKKGAQQRSLSEIEPAKQAGYAAEKTDIVFQLKTTFETALKTQELEALYRNIELPLLRVLAAMELEGIRVDVPFLNELSKTLSTDVEGLEKQVYETAGSSFNLASPKQLGEVLFEQLKLVDKPKKTKTGQYATGEEILTKLAPKHPIVKDILEWRGLVKLKNTYTDALPEQVNPATGKIHTTFSQAVAATGRLSSNHPNLQNIPIRTVRGKAVRKAFIPRSEDYLLLSADYSQIELRIIAALSKDPGMIEAFQKGEDIHAATAAKIFNIPLQEVTKTQRGEAKAVNFGIVYGQGAFTLAQQLQQSRSEAKALIDHYYTSFPTLKQFIANQVGFAREHGYVSTISGRRRYLHNINSQNAIVRSGDERNAVNAPIQGSAADIIKMAMIHIHEHFQKAQCRSKMLLQVHDELVFDIHKEEVDRLAPVIRTAMENAFDLGLPLTVEMGTGHHWLAAH